MIIVMKSTASKEDVENGIDRVKNFTEEKWNDFKDKLE